MKAYWGSGGIAPRIFYLSTRWRWVVSFTPRPLYYMGKSPWYLLDRRLGGPQSRYGRGCEEKKSQLLSGDEPPIIQLVAQRCTTGLSLRCKISNRHATKAYWGVEVQLHVLLTLPRDGGERSVSRRGHYYYYCYYYYYYYLHFHLFTIIRLLVIFCG
jgi:hypothetical protein